MKKFLILFLLLISFGCPAQSSGSQFSGIIVATDGSGDYEKIQDAINSVPDNHPQRTVIFVKNGKYDSEKLIVPRQKHNITLVGEDREKTIISYHLYDCNSPHSGNKCPAESWELWKEDTDLIYTSATFTVHGNHFIMENLTLENTAGPVGQALALCVMGERGIYRNCNFYGYQDTICLWATGKCSFFENCTITGRVDFIYGSGIGYFESCEILSYGAGYITAPATPKEQPYGFVFHRCRVAYLPGSPKAEDDGKKYALGRPWHNFPKVAWILCHFDEMLHPEGWPTNWNMNYAISSPDLQLYEYKNTGPGADMSGRAQWAGLRALTDAELPGYSKSNVLGFDPN